MSVIRLCQAVLAWDCWLNMKEMKSSHETGGLLTLRGPLCWSSRHTNTLMHTQEQNSPWLVPASHQMAHLFRPSAQQDAGLLVPTDRQPNSPQAAWQAGTCDSLDCWRSNANRHSLLSGCSATILPQKKKSLSVSPINHETNQCCPEPDVQTVMHLAVNHHTGQRFAGRDLSFVMVRRQLKWDRNKLKRGQQTTGF